MSHENHWIEIPGTPVPQPRHRISARGEFVRVYIPKSHPVHEYKRRIAEATKYWPVFTGPVAVVVVAKFPMPASWSKKKRLEKADKPHEQKPDPDNISKAILDALNGCWRDDCQVSDLWVRKRWTDREEGCTVLHIEEST